MSLKLTNNATSTLASNVLIGDTTMTVQTADAALFPTLGAGDWCPATVVDAAGHLEIVRITGRASAVLTVTRNQEGTSARAWTAGDRIDVRVTLAALAALETPDAIHGATAKTSLVDADEFSLWDSVATAFKKVTWANIYAAVGVVFGAIISSKGAKSTPVDADQLVLADFASSNATVKLSWLNLITNVFTRLGGLINGATAKGTPVDADAFAIMDSAASNATKKVLWSAIKATLKAYFDPYYLSGYPTGHLFGLTLSNNASDATNDIDIAAGNARSADDTANMVLASALTKRLDAAWAVGTGNGGLDTGSVGNNTYFIWLIKRSDTGVVDALFSLSNSAPTMPTSYDLKRLRGRLTRTAGVNGPVETGRSSGGSGPDIIIEDQKASGTDGGTFTSGADRTRDLTNKVFDPLGLASLATNQFTLGGGTWYVRWAAPAVKVNGHQAFLYNTSDSAVVARGGSLRAESTNESNVSMGACVFTIAGSKTFEIRHRGTSTQASNGFGLALSFGTEVYTHVEIWKVA